MIAVTGATGLLGSKITQQLAEDSIPFFGIKRSSSNTSLLGVMEWREADLLDVSSLMEAMQGATLVIHTAALVSFNAKDGDLLYRINVEGTRNIVNTCLSLGIPRLIHISSVAALGRHKGVNDIDENNKWVDNKLNSEYAESKYLAELEVFRGQEEGLKIDIINPSIILAQSDWNKSSSQLFKYAWQSKPFYTEGAVNYVDVRDVVNMIMLLINREASGQRIISNGGSVTLLELLSQMAGHFNKKAPWIKVPKPLVATVAHLESIRSWLTRTEPMVTPQSARSAQEKFFYNNKKAITELGMQFRTLNETLEWCCPYYQQLQTATTNKRN